ncbi:RagB/SusD family nutrient uptake outer membrane protein [Plebeiibacterium sediminum]|uniref:RagB/SusD family nutrient uptake outer membrane protein n=1 Tax=Plebeiibacterium sediminum TaxID=2992112 RepID=A0AAE3SGZ4_9BACT|nr:RagB/SusD family nutrient uptake outer membrane protein [Plebeiobacterium sediminum]MCW3788998.1 RagB/SusD family nutrient uptake outer membrane protein [Plebeiobacterium sediminum]
MKNIFKLLVLMLVLASCDDMLDPALENIRDIDAMYKEPTFATGVLANAYILLPYSSGPNNEVATDNAVTNDISDNYLEMATGSWSADDNPLSQWDNRQNAIQYINLFLERTDGVVWSQKELVNTMFNDRYKGEAYALRALNMYYLLLAHGGWTEDGRLLGTTIRTESESVESDLNKPRDTFQDCIDQIFADLDMAISLLPLDYGDIADSEIPSKYASLGVTNAGDYNRANGNSAKGRVSGRIAQAIKAQVALLAASPAYQNGTNVTYEDAANHAATVLNHIGGPSGLDMTGGTWYTNDDIDNLGAGVTPAEVLWRGNMSLNNDLESDNFPPSLYGSGRINPTQNLVDAFPMLNGYPISDVNSNFDAANPYENRDPRLQQYVVVNESTQGPLDAVVITGTYSDNSDGINKDNGYSTRTGYYLRKLLRSDCNPNPSVNNRQNHYTARIRYTEIFLDYAEAANEAWGPTGTGGNAYSAYDIIKAIRERAGIDAEDAYLQSVVGDKALMRELIRNERRIELCFENHRFWDLRRWNVSLDKLNETATGVQISKVDGAFTFTPIDVEDRDYKEYMYHGPIPYNETLKWSALEQNAGW